MKKKIIFALVALLLLGGTAITFSQNSASASVSITAGGNGGEISTVKNVTEANADTKMKYSTGSDPAPYTGHTASWSPVVNTAGSVTAGDLYYMDTTGYTGDVLVTVYMTNAGMLVRDYTYLNFQVNVWSGTTGAWIQAARADDSPISSVYLTEINGSVNFVLLGNTEYCITIDGGSYYCISTNAAGGSLEPAFYIEVKQAY